MTIPAFFAPSIPELIVGVVATLFSLAVPLGVAYLVWNTYQQRRGTAGGAFRGEGGFTETVVGGDGTLRVEMPLGPRWAGRPVRVVVGPIGRL